MLVLFNCVFLFLKGESKVIDEEIIGSSTYDYCRSSDEILGPFHSYPRLEHLQVLSKVVQLVGNGNHLLQL